MGTRWKVELLSRGGWRQIGFPDDEAEARKLFERAIREYPADWLIRLREGEEVRKVQPAEWCAPPLTKAIRGIG
jgi:hypothetical protein